MLCEEKTCFYCHKPGHVIANCLTLKHKEQTRAKQSSPPKGIGLIKEKEKNIRSTMLNAAALSMNASLHFCLKGKFHSQRNLKVNGQFVSCEIQLVPSQLFSRQFCQSMTSQHMDIAPYSVGWKWDTCTA